MSTEIDLLIWRADVCRNTASTDWAARSDTGPKPGNVVKMNDFRCERATTESGPAHGVSTPRKTERKERKKEKGKKTRYGVFGS